jgi:uncharacterized protein YcgI (DUF1989 family)
MTNEVLIKGRHGGRIDVRKGQLLEILNVEGQQICDFFAFNKANVREHLSPSHTRSVNARIYLRKGDVLSTVLRRPMLELVEDTCGQHDMTIPACDPQRYRISYGIVDHRSCRMNLFQMIASEGIPYEYLPDPVNFFQNTPIGEDAHYHRSPSPSEPGDKVVLKALMDLIAVGSACPQDMTGSNGDCITDIKFIVRDA